MLCYAMLLSLPLSGLALPSPSSSALDLAWTDKVAGLISSSHLAKRQSISTAEEDEILENYGQLLLDVSETQTTRAQSSCKGVCATYVDVLQTCAEGISSIQTASCACRSSNIDTMMSCANCIGSEQQLWARGFENLCNEATDSTIATSSLSASSPSSSSSADPVNGYGTVTVGTDAVTIATFNPSVNYFTRTSDLWDSTALRNGDGTFTETGTSTASRASETRAVSGGEDVTDAAVMVRGGRGAVLGVVAVVAALVAL
ncbi:hypothetical protein JCM8547_009006 [Rhodosporidiobolus lusitaniae]